MGRWRAVFVASLACTGLVATSGRASAEPRVHVGLGVAHAVGRPQSRQFGFGGAGTLALELPLVPALGVQAELSSLALSAGEPADVGVLAKGTGFTFGGMLGAR
ncbi:MAG TPA: hypothetical protein VM925_31975, partial [Labilithrix sp.]|nr:hypothetical protein [Labilithrix sp.]